MSQGKIDEAKPPESDSDKKARLEAEILELEKAADAQRRIGQGDASHGS